MADTALIFPGQGSQDVGMGRDVAEAYPEARHLYQQADDILGFALSELCFQGPRELLDETANTQPALFVTSLALVEALKAEGKLPAAAMVAGHSLGELTALVAGGAMGFEEGLRLVRERGRLMKLAGERSPGGMAAVLKMDDADVEQACKEAAAETSRPVQIANYNSPGQVVISGDAQALDRAIELLRQRGGKRIVPLAVSIPAHSPLMASVVREYRAAVDATNFCLPVIPVVANISARPLLTVDEIRDELAGQFTWPVRWTASVQWMVEQGVKKFVEIGPKEVLAGLVRRIDGSVEAQSVGSLEAVRNGGLA
ncbi:MAG: ACP S-malonyltransferase [Anaerolineae bacterium]|jgi:[acyl-carrier-protein] S-malonyltransferase|nr:ACP S-malonyltransferase [Anaerolineae bacterium]